MCCGLKRWMFVNTAAGRDARGIGRRLACFERRLEAARVRRHLPGGLAPNNERYQQLPDAVALEVDDDGDARAGAAIQRLNVNGNDAADRPVGAVIGPTIRWDVCGNSDVGL